MILLITTSAQPADSFTRLFDFEHNMLFRNEHDGRDYSELHRLFYPKLQTEISDTLEIYRVLHLGDSHIQGDGFTGRIRQVLNRGLTRVGEGTVFPDKFGQSYGQKSITGSSKGRWITSQVMKGPYKDQVGITGYAYTLLDSAGKLNFIFKEKPSACTYRDVEITLRSTQARITLKPGSDWRLLNTYKFGEDILVYILRSDNCSDTLSATFHNPNFALAPIHFLGIRLPLPTEELTYQRSAVTGSQLLHWDRNPGFSRELHRYEPDVIIVSLGTNDAYNTAIKNTGFGRRLLDFIDSFRTHHPQSIILFTTPPPSRGVNRSFDRYEYMLSEMADKLPLRDVLIYDLHRIMGGDTGIDNWNKRLLIARDLIHYKKEGYMLQADLFLLALGRFLQLEEVDVLQAPADNVRRYVP